MKTDCFACDVFLEAETLDGLEELFLAHGVDVHQWDHPEEALRNYVRNYAGAIERLSQDTARLPVIGDLTIHPVTEDRLADWFDLFDHRGFAGNPGWAACYCREPHDPPSDDEPEKLWTANRAYTSERLRAGTTYGYLAYADGVAVGWVNASTRSDYAIFKLLDPDSPDPKSVVGVSCFVIDPKYRRHGIAAALLDRVIADAPGRGAAFVEAYPRNQPDPGDGPHFRGPRSLYDARGFDPIEVRERDTVVRLAVS
ncbi:MAG TPA: GNAT family N-acetyltransferase [Acidimicrobiia bacterium]|nr:GNAT family N-acetyltransferase [Acidimicrobiia bacterium]